MRLLNYRKMFKMDCDMKIQIMKYYGKYDPILKEKYAHRHEE